MRSERRNGCTVEDRQLIANSVADSMRELYVVPSDTPQKLQELLKRLDNSEDQGYVGSNRDHVR